LILKRQSTMKNSKRAREIDPPSIPLDKLEPTRLSALAEQLYELLRIEDSELHGFAGADARFESSILARVDLSGSKLKCTRMLDVRIEKSHLSNAEWDRANLRRVEIVGTRATGLALQAAELRDVTFKDCRADFARINSSKLVGVRFEQCRMTEADFSDTSMTRVVFAGCDLTNVDFTRARIVSVDLGGSSIDGLKLAPEQLRGLTIDMPQALQIVTILGATIT
jgi:uncharacterized protein YjbI with pentapeptide repeats